MHSLSKGTGDKYFARPYVCAYGAFGASLSTHGVGHGSLRLFQGGGEELEDEIFLLSYYMKQDIESVFRWPTSFRKRMFKRLETIRKMEQGIFDA